MIFRLLMSVVVVALPWIGETCVEFVAELPGGPARAVDLEGDLAVYSSGRVLVVADVAVPSDPVELGRVVLPGVIQDVDLVGDRVYAAMGVFGLAVVDLGDPEAPVLRGQVAAGVGETIDVAVVEPHAFTVELEHVTEYASLAHLDVIDVSDPSRPVLVGSVETAYRLSAKLAASGDIVYMAAASSGWPNGPRGGVSAWDMSDPERPTELPSPNPSLTGAWGIAVAAGSLFVLGGSGLEVFDLGDPASPVPVGHLEWDYGFGRLGDLAVFEGLAVVASAYGLTTLDVSDLEHPTFVGSLGRPGNGLRVAAHGPIAAVVADAGGLRIIDVENPAEPTALGGLETPGSAEFVAIVGDLAVVSAKWDGYFGVGDARLIDVSDPTQPAELGTLPVSPRRGRVAVEGSRAYVMTGGHQNREPGLAVIDIADPTTPVEQGFVPTDGVDAGMDLRWPYAYLVGLGVLRIIDVGVPSAPTLVYEMEIENGASSIVLDGDHAYMGRFTNSPGIVRLFQVLDISDPLVPAYLGSETGGPYLDLDVSDGLVVGASSTGMAIVDARDPMDPEHLYSTQMKENEDYAVDVDGRTAAVIRVLQTWDGNPGYRDFVSVFHLDNPEWPRQVAMFEIPVRGKDVGVSDDLVFVAGGAAGIYIYDVSACGVPTARRSTGRVTP
jgi:hypothetical protein